MAMTTTLRPASPEQRGPDGGRVRAYRIYDNSRAVGSLLLRTGASSGPPTGWIEEVAVEPADRRRGRATVAALVAEEELRRWGCSTALVAVPGGARAAWRLARALGYVERNRHLTKRLDDPPPPSSAELTSRAMSDQEYRAWRAAEERRYCQVLIGGGASPAQAAFSVAESFREGLPHGLRSEGTSMRVLAHDRQDVGTLWLAVREGLRLGVDGFVFSVEVAGAHRGQGHGRALMREAERICHAEGARTLGLNVLVENAPALGLYTSLGYHTVMRYLSKPLG